MSYTKRLSEGRRLAEEHKALTAEGMTDRNATKAIAENNGRNLAATTSLIRLGYQF